MYRQPKGKIILILLVPFILGGLFQGINDAIFSNNSMFNLFYGLYLGCLAGGLDVSWIPVIVPTSNYLNPTAGTITTISFLIGIFVCIFIASTINQKYQIGFSKNEKLLFLLTAILIFSAIWDMIFMIILFNIWSPQMLSTTVDWLPPVNLGVIQFKIGFSWETGIWFMFSRFAIASYLIYYLAIPKKGKVKSVEYY